MQFFLLLVLLSNLIIPATSVAGSLYSELSPKDQTYWKKLLHTDQNGISRADGENFFLYPDGKKNSELEFLATINAFKNPNAQSGWFKYHPQCVFRERYRFIKSLGLIPEIEEKNCKEFEEWKKGLNAESVTLIFSSSYPNNPSSLFGHTLIRLNQKNKTNDLLDYSVAFSAIPNPDDIGIVFAYKGMFGGYQGILEVSKYYIKVNDYNNFESRDLIEYQLKMTTEQLNRLINHLWEIYQTTYFDYFFWDENCSSVLADILAVPYDNISVNQHARWYYLPSEMVKVFTNNNLIETEHFRPSLKKKLEKKLSYLKTEEISAVKKLEFEKSLVVNDGVITYLDFLRNQHKNYLPPEENKILRSALLKRSAGPQAEVKNEQYADSNRPELGHNPRKISLLGTNHKVGLELKQGHHDLMSNDLGFDPFSQFDFLGITLLYEKDRNKVLYDQFTFVDLVSLHPYRFYDPQFSWQGTVAGDNSNAIYAKGLMGVSLNPYEQSIFSLLAGLEGDLDSQYKHTYKIRPMGKVIFLTNLGTHAKLGVFDEFQFSKNVLSINFSYFLTQNTELRVLAKKRVIQFNYGYFF